MQHLGSLTFQIWGAIIVLFSGAAGIGVQHLGYVEFGVVGRKFADGAFRRQLHGQIALRIGSRFAKSVGDLD